MSPKIEEHLAQLAARVDGLEEFESYGRTSFDQFRTDIATLRGELQTAIATIRGEISAMKVKVSLWSALGSALAVLAMALATKLL
jgi:hypothetical protein